MWFVLLCGELARFARERKGPAITKDLLGKSCFLNEFWAGRLTFHFSCEGIGIYQEY
jgi:hypothetical protein